jgi:pilus assembly protein Flp/PilA
MRSFIESVGDFVKREDGPTAVEYAVMLDLVVVVCPAAIATLRTNSNKTYSKVGSAIGTTRS